MSKAVRLLCLCNVMVSGNRNLLPEGTVVELEDGEASHLIAARLADPADYVPPPPQKPPRRATLADLSWEELNG